MRVRSLLQCYRRAIFACASLLVSTSTWGDELADRIAAVPNPKAIDSTWVADPANVIARRRDEINQLLSQLERETGAEVAVVVLPTIGELIPKNFAVSLVEKWGVGKRGQDNGVLVLHVLDQRRIEIETGYGMEAILPDVKAHWITEEIAVPFFKAGSLADGHLEIVRAVIRGIRDPNIDHARLVGPWTTQPGQITDPLPALPKHDAIALQYASLPDKVVYSPKTPVLLLLLGALVFAGATVIYWLRSRGKEPYAKYQLLKSGLSLLQYGSSVPAAASAWAFENARTGSFFSPVPIFLATLFATSWGRSRALRSLRDAPRTCQCGQPMRRIDEQHDNAYIEKGQAAEEAIESVDYDVWVCTCGRSHVESYRGRKPADACTQCHYKTFRITGTRTLQAATTSSTGLREVTHTCAFCHFTKIDRVTIPKISTSSSSSSGSSGGGSSFGGGRSGGGGSGSSY